MAVHSIQSAARNDTRTACIVSLDELAVDAMIGALGEEQGRTQPLVIAVEAEIVPPTSDLLETTLDYRFIAEAARQLASGHINLIETFATRLGEACLGRPGVKAVQVAIRKPEAIPGAVAGTTVRLRKNHVNSSERQLS